MPKYTIDVFFQDDDAENRCKCSLWIDNADDVGDAYRIAHEIMENSGLKKPVLGALMLGHHTTCGNIIVEKKKSNG